jgi:hypothetical protein
MAMNCSETQTNLEFFMVGRYSVQYCIYKTDVFHSYLGLVLCDWNPSFAAAAVKVKLWAKVIKL